jgi:hypothetical protein
MLPGKETYAPLPDPYPPQSYYDSYFVTLYTARMKLKKNRNKSVLFERALDQAELTEYIFGH